jgi:hypothetical protein
MYGTPEGVAALSAQWTDNGAWVDPDVYETGTNPTLTQIENWLVQVSNAVDVRLADHGFAVPVDEPKAVSDLALFVEGIVKDLADYSHGSGRFYSTRAIEGGLSPFITIDREITDWVARRTIGFEALGVPKRQIAARNDATLDVL